jgi:nucleoside 2-deoxyribosyltransferase
MRNQYVKFKDVIRQTIRRFGETGIKALFPNLDSGLDKDDLDMETMRRLCQDHFRAIENSEALYVIDPDGYVGTLVKVEIGYALGKGKPVYFSEKTNSLDLDSLPEDVIPLDSMERFLET